MSASVATSAVGLLDRHYSDSNAPEWSDGMDIDRSNKGRSEDVEPEDAELDRTQSNAQSESDRRETIGGLLAALATTSTSLSVEPASRRSATPPADSPISQISQTELMPPRSQLQIEDADEEVAASGTNDARLPLTESSDVNSDGVIPTTLTSMPTDPTFHFTMPPLPESIQAMALAQPDVYTPLTQEQMAMALSDQDLSMPFPDMAMDMTMPIDGFIPPLEYAPTPVNVKRQYDAFARLEFADGIFYLNTYQCELGRDQHAFREAMRKEREAEEAAEYAKNQPKSSSGKVSQRMQSIKAESQVHGSVVSEAGGFAGVDEQPDAKNDQNGDPHSSQPSEGSLIRPLDMHHNPSLVPFDYHKDVVYNNSQPAPIVDNDPFEDEQPAPVTADHLPDPGSCPLIPIHPTIAVEQSEVDSMKGISRRHIKIFWSWKESAFFMEVLGRNGAFFDEEHMDAGECVQLYSGAKIQISAVQFTFRLPITNAETPAEDNESSANSEEALETSPNGAAATTENGQPVKLKLKLNTESSESQIMGANGELKRRGPGRPPKNGVMSQREMKEREKAEKEAKARAIHGIPSPPPPQRKPSKSQPPNPELIPEALKPEKRKYTKRKREDGEEEDVVPSIEAQDVTPVAEKPPPQPTTKRARTKSFSPPYKPFAECTPEDLARPPHNYAVLLYMVLTETGEITLRQVYKEMQSRWPYFKYVVDSDGWTSSVRHNLNQEVGKLFARGRKEGKGFTWLPILNAMEEYQAQKNKRSNAPPAPKPRPPPQRPNFPPSQGQQLTWQNNGPMPQPNANGNNFPSQGPWSGQQNGANRPGQAGVQPNSTSASNSQRSVPARSQPPIDPNWIPPPELLSQYYDRPAPVFLPLTFQGLAIVHRFEASMYQTLPQDEETQNKWKAIFHSAKQRTLYGGTASVLPDGETNEERTIITHINNFINTYRNPFFINFAARTAVPPINGRGLSTASPASGSVPPSTGPPAPPTSTISATIRPLQAPATQQPGPSLPAAPAASSSDTHSHPAPVHPAPVAASSVSVQAVSATPPNVVTAPSPVPVVTTTATTTPGVAAVTSTTVPAAGLSAATPNASTPLVAPGASNTSSLTSTVAKGNVEDESKVGPKSKTDIQNQSGSTPAQVPASIVQDKPQVSDTSEVISTPKRSMSPPAPLPA